MCLVLHRAATDVGGSGDARFVVVWLLLGKDYAAHSRGFVPSLKLCLRIASEN